MQEYIDKLLQNFSPSEVLIVQAKTLNDFTTAFGNDFHTFYLEDWVLPRQTMPTKPYVKHFNTKSLKGLWYFEDL